MSLTSVAAPRVPANAVSVAWRTLYWSVRRELWENRSIYIAPLVTGAIFVAGFVATLMMMPERLTDSMSMGPMFRHAKVVEPYLTAALFIMGVGVVVGVFYCLDALYAERRDRSILFWKSLPVSDRTTVISKLTVALIILPLITTLVTAVVHVLMLLASSAALMMGGAGVAPLWREVKPMMLLSQVTFHMVTMHILWYAPLYGWLLLASALARRAAFLWAGIPILAVVAVEKLVFSSSRFWDVLKLRLFGGGELFINSTNPIEHVNPTAFFSSPHLWIGLVLAAVLIAAAVQVRRRNGPA